MLESSRRRPVLLSSPAWRLLIHIPCIRSWLQKQFSGRFSPLKVLVGPGDILEWVDFMHLDLNVPFQHEIEDILCVFLQLLSCSNIIQERRPDQFDILRRQAPAESACSSYGKHQRKSLTRWKTARPPRWRSQSSPCSPSSRRTPGSYQTSSSPRHRTRRRLPRHPSRS